MKIVKQGNSFYLVGALNKRKKLSLKNKRRLKKYVKENYSN